jgi:hypothetical protein
MIANTERSEHIEAIFCGFCPNIQVLSKVTQD